MSKQFHEAANDASLWRRYFIKQFGVDLVESPLSDHDRLLLTQQVEGRATKLLFMKHFYFSACWRVSNDGDNSSEHQLLYNHYSTLFNLSDFIAELDVAQNWRQMVAIAAFQPSSFALNLKLLEPDNGDKLTLVWNTQWCEFRENAPSLVKKGLAIGDFDNCKVLLLGPSDQSYFLLFKLDLDGESCPSQESDADRKPTQRRVYSPDSAGRTSTARVQANDGINSRLVPSTAPFAIGNDANNQIRLRTNFAVAPAPAVFGSSPTSTFPTSLMPPLRSQAPWGGTHSRNSSGSSMRSHGSSVSGGSGPEPITVNLSNLEDHLTCVALESSIGKVCAGTRERNVSVFDIDASNCQLVRQLRTAEYCTQIALDSRLAYVGTRKGVELFDLRCSVQDKRLHILRHKDSVMSVQPVPWCHLIVTSSHDKVVKIWDDRTHKTIHNISPSDLWETFTRNSPSNTPLLSSVPPPSAVHYGLHRLLVNWPGYSLVAFDRYTFQIISKHAPERFNGHIMASDEVSQRVYGSAGYSHGLDTIQARSSHITTQS